jgi:hypothetical protein
MSSYRVVNDFKDSLTNDIEKYLQANGVPKEKSRVAHLQLNFKNHKVHSLLEKRARLLHKVNLKEAKKVE